MKIVIVIDNPTSWMVPYVETLNKRLLQSGYDVSTVNSAEDITRGDIACFISCEQIVPKSTLDLNSHNLVVHESALPQGKGMSPLTWQILEGKNNVPITLFEATESVDSGDIYLQDEMVFDGTELIADMRKTQGEKTIELILKFVDMFPNVSRSPQEGEESVYPRRGPTDGELDITLPLESQINLLRISDNERYPAFFVYKGQKYIIKTSKDSEE